MMVNLRDISLKAAIPAKLLSLSCCSEWGVQELNLQQHVSIS